MAQFLARRFHSHSTHCADLPDGKGPIERSLGYRREQSSEMSLNVSMTKLETKGDDEEKGVKEEET